MTKLNCRVKNIFFNPYVIALLSFLLLLFTGSLYFMDIDEGVWNVIGTCWSKFGMPPYKYVLDDKSPAIHMLFALSNILFGVNTWFPRMLGSISIALTSVVLYKTGKKLRDDNTGLISMVLFSLSMMWVKFSGPITSHTESFMVLFTCLGFYFIIFLKDEKNRSDYRLKLFSAGLCIGIAVSFKQIALFDCIAFLVIFFLMDKKSDNKSFLFGTIIILCGIISAILLSIIPLLLSGVSIKDYFISVWLNIFIMFIDQKGTSSTITAKIFNFFPAWRSNDIILFYPLLFLFIIQKKQLKKDGFPFTQILLWLFFAFLGVNSVGFYWGHQFKQIIPPLALIGGTALSKLKDYPSIKKEKKLIRISLISIFLLWFPWVAFTNHLDNKGLWQVKQVGLWLKKNTSANDYLYCYGTIPYGYAMIIQAYSERKTPTKYITPFSLDFKDAPQKIAEDIINYRPKYIVIPKRLDYKIPSSLEKTLDMFYNLKTTYYGFLIYGNKKEFF